MIEASARNPPGWTACTVTKVDGEHFTVQLRGKFIFIIKNFQSKFHFFM